MEYDNYWNELGLDNNPYPRPIVGTEHQEEIGLNSYNWIKEASAPHSYHQRNVLEAVKGSGFWPVEIAETGLYQFDVRRWPKELNHPIRAALPSNKKSDITLLGKPVVIADGKAIPAVKVRLRIGNQLLEKEISKTDVSALFELKLPAGETVIEAWLVDADGNEQNAYYTYVRKINTF